VTLIQAEGCVYDARLEFEADMSSTRTLPAPTRQLLSWIAERPRSYAETIDAWKTSCPRLSVWEDALSDRLVRVDSGSVLLTDAGAELLTTRG
jgi:hypothetical protein